MSTVIEYRLLPGTGAAVGRAGTQSVIADRPEGRAGGMGLGFNGGELLALALGGCLSNDVQYVADEMGLTVVDLAITVEVDFGGQPTTATDARMTVVCKLADDADPAELIARAKARCTIANTLRVGVPVAIESELPL
jgi:organic hydroperoxide reductase OsmC/OhrA